MSGARRFRDGLLAALVALWGCSAPNGGRVIPDRPAGPEPPVTALRVEGLGLSLAPLSDRIPRDLEPLRQLVDRLGGAFEIRLVRPAAPADARTALTSLVGVPRVAPDETRVLVEGDPPRLRLLPSDPLFDERAGQGDALLRAGHFPEARAAFVAALALQDGPEPLGAIGDTYAREERWDEARALYDEATRRFPWSARSWARLGRLYLTARRLPPAAAALARAVALHPGEPMVEAWIAAERRLERQPSILPPAVRRADLVWELRAPAASAEELFVLAEAEAYAVCKEAFRRSRALRILAAGLDDERWLWSPAEESVCTALWIGAYVENQGRGRTTDPALEELIELGEQGRLEERALHDVAGPIQPQAALLLPPAARDRLVDFVARYRVREREGEGWLLR